MERQIDGKKWIDRERELDRGYSRERWMDGVMGRKSEREQVQKQ